MKPLPLLRNQEVLEQPANQETLTRRYTDEALKFISDHRDRPFLLYLAHTFPHVPLYASSENRGRSRRGLYGDVVEEIDRSTGEILAALRSAGLERRTLVMFTSDNGPWLIKNQDGGSAGLLREGKGSTYEGGMRVPGIFWWPGRIQPAVRIGLTGTLDILPTLAALADAKAPADRSLDGIDISPLLLEGQSLPDRPFFYYRESDLYAVRKGPWKAHLITQPGYGDKNPIRHDPPQLYNLEQDPSERFDLSAQQREVVADLLREVERHRSSFKPAVSLLDATIAAPTTN
jgi:arylsulfatase A-like enzyme